MSSRLALEEGLEGQLQKLPGVRGGRRCSGLTTVAVILWPAGQIKNNRLWLQFA